MRKLIHLCDDDDKKLMMKGRQNSWNEAINLSKFKYKVFQDNLSSTPDRVDDVDNIVANLFISNSTPGTIDPPIILVALSFPDIVKSHTTKVELLRTHNSAAMFLCCCGKEVKGLKAPSCGCAINDTTCSRTCMFNQTPSGGLFYHRTVQIIKHIRNLHPHSTIWLTGFGFCGALASLLTQTFHDQTDSSLVSAITFHAPGDFWFAQRQGLYPPTVKRPNHNIPIYNVGLSSNPIFVKSVSSIINKYGKYLYYQTHVRTGIDCVIQTLGEKKTEYHSIYHLEDAIWRLQISDSAEIHCQPAEYTDSTKECEHYTYVEEDVPHNYIHVMGAP